MSNRYFEIRRESGHGGNFIPSGRQLPRTPPFQDVKKCLDFDAEDGGRDFESVEVRYFTAALRKNRPGKMQNNMRSFISRKEHRAEMRMG